MAFNRRVLPIREERDQDEQLESWKLNSSICIWWSEECERLITAKRYAYLNANIVTQPKHFWSTREQQST
jgi:hypothetical protein